jgi:hypothetical protein
MFSGSSFWLALSVHAVDLKMNNEGDVAGLEVTVAGPHPSTVFYGWAGRRFVKTARPPRIRANRKPHLLFRSQSK